MIFIINIKGETAEILKAHHSRSMIKTLIDLSIKNYADELKAKKVGPSLGKKRSK